LLKLLAMQYDVALAALLVDPGYQWRRFPALSGRLVYFWLVLELKLPAPFLLEIPMYFS
jgi:hypothetical protein